MNSKWRQLVPHFIAMLGLYALGVLLLALITGHSAFWSSILIALVVAFTYPPMVRRLGWAPDVWVR